LFKRFNSLGEKHLHNHVSFNKKMTMGIALAASITLGVQSVSAQAENSLSTVYHVYLDGQYMGTVDNQNVIEQVATIKINNVKETYKDLDLTIEELEIIPEKMFRPVYNNNETVNSLEKDLDVVVESTALRINEKEVAYFKSKAEAEAVLKQYKLQYVSEDVLKEVEERIATKQVPDSLEEGQSRVEDVTFSEDVSMETKKVFPDKIISSEQGLNLLEKGSPEEKQYVVQENDVLSSIAESHDLTLEELLSLNPKLNEDSVIQSGDLLNVTVLKPYVTVNVKEESLIKENVAFETEIKEDANLPQGEEEVSQKGQNGEKLVNYVTYKQNGTEVKHETVNEEVIKQPVNEVIIKGTKVIPSRGTGNLAWPAVGGYISSGLGQRWGKLHKGIDIARPSDRTINAADNGTVISAGVDGGYGNKVVIDHNNGVTTLYAHLDSISVSAGQVVSQGQKIGVMGTTGNSTGVHLHFEVYENGDLKNPVDYLK
jgi:murein DD-endopeptidase MepM/ murein hydrolase activator NlpD